jgi:hypothetical protein
LTCQAADPSGVKKPAQSGLLKISEIPQQFILPFLLAFYFSLAWR